MENIFERLNILLGDTLQIIDHMVVDKEHEELLYSVKWATGTKANCYRYFQCLKIGTINYGSYYRKRSEWNNRYRKKIRVTFTRWLSQNNQNLLLLLLLMEQQLYRISDWIPLINLICWTVCNKFDHCLHLLSYQSNIVKIITAVSLNGSVYSLKL